MKLVSKKYLNEIYNNNAYLNMILIAIENVLDGNEPSDFEMSFEIVRRVWDLKEICDRMNSK
jgi:hypothetical protein